MESEEYFKLVQITENEIAGQAGWNRLILHPQQDARGDNDEEIMPYLPATPCNFPGCRNFTHGRYCAEHKPAHHLTGSAARRPAR